MCGRRLAVLCAVVALVATGVASGATNAATWNWHQLDADRCWDATTIDANFNGLIDTAWYDVDNDCRMDTRLWNSVGGDGFLESMTFDMDEDGHWEYWLSDTDQREGYEIVYFDDTGDGRYDRWAYLPKSTPSTSLADLIQGSTVVGGTPQRSGAMGLVVTLAGVTGRAVWAGPLDSDRDGVLDSADRFPRDNRYY
jgi:hypothetical protein